MRGASFRKLTARYPAQVIAARAGVGVATVRRWRRAGKAPSKHDAALSSLAGVRPPSAADIRRALRVSSALELARLSTGQAAPSKAAVDRARAWKRARSIPLDYRGFLFEQAPEPTLARAVAGVTNVYSGRSWDLVTVAFELSGQMLGINSLNLVLDMLRDAFLSHEVSGAKYQAAITGQSPLAKADVTWADKSPDDATVMVRLDAKTTLFDIVTWGASFSSIEEAMFSIRKKMQPKFQFSFRLTQALAMIRIKK